MAERYREQSLTQGPRHTAPFVGDIEIVFDDNGKSYYRIRSRTNPNFVHDEPMAGDPVDVQRALLREKQLMDDYDKRRMPGAHHLKEDSKAKRKKVAARPGPKCPVCDGTGVVENECGSEDPCYYCNVKY